MALLLLIPFVLLIIEGLLAHWLVKRLVKFNQPLKYEKLIRFLIALVLFAIFAFTTLYLIVVNFTFER